jgi:hypothetical protein
MKKSLSPPGTIEEEKEFEGLKMYVTIIHRIILALSWMKSII